MPRTHRESGASETDQSFLDGCVFDKSLALENNVKSLFSRCASLLTVWLQSRGAQRNGIGQWVSNTIEKECGIPKISSDCTPAFIQYEPLADVGVWGLAWPSSMRKIYMLAGIDFSQVNAREWVPHLAGMEKGERDRLRMIGRN